MHTRFVGQGTNVCPPSPPHSHPTPQHSAGSYAKVSARACVGRVWDQAGVDSAGACPRPANGRPCPCTSSWAAVAGTARGVDSTPPHATYPTAQPCRRAPSQQQPKTLKPTNLTPQPCRGAPSQQQTLSLKPTNLTPQACRGAP
eukprot:362417-Chlamydomonas_euryale.AAC.2